jgi:hypothetical protein
VFRNVVPGGAAGAAPVKFRPVGRRSSPEFAGEGLGKGLRPTRGRFGVLAGGERAAGGGSVAQPCGVRLELASGEPSAGAREWVAREALLGSREGAGGVGWHWVGVGRQLYCGGAMAGWRALRPTRDESTDA